LSELKSQSGQITTILNALVEKVCFDYDYLIYDMEDNLIGVYESGVHKDGFENYIVIETIVSYLQERKFQPFPKILNDTDIEKIEIPASSEEDKFTYLTNRTQDRYLNESWAENRNLNMENCDYECHCDEKEEEDYEECFTDYGGCECFCYCN
jgi:hypothetical protein